MLSISRRYALVRGWVDLTRQHKNRATAVVDEPEIVISRIRRR